MFSRILVLILIFSSIAFSIEFSPEEREKYGKLLANPVADLRILSIQYNYNDGIGPFETGENTLIRILPVLPVKINDDWNIILRSIIPISETKNFSPQYEDKQGLGDILQYILFSPTAKGDLTWGVGPVFTLPVATEDEYGSSKYTLGAGGAILAHSGDWTYGILGNTLWEVAEKNERGVGNYPLSYIQPFVTERLKNGMSITVTSETFYDWTTHEKMLPVFVMVNQILPHTSIGPGYYIDSSENYNSNWIFRLQFTFLFPKR